MSKRRKAGPSSGDKGTCKTCGAAILWVVLASGKRHPLNAEPEVRYVEYEGGWALSKTYLTHFATCPDAAHHRLGRDR